MHSFEKIVEMSSSFMLSALSESNERVLQSLHVSAETPTVQTLQMLRLHKAIFSVGMFSIFEADLQKRLNCSNGFSEVKRILLDEGELAIKEQFDDICFAINVLKHGKGRSYDALVSRKDVLPFKIKTPTDLYLTEGDVSEVSILVDVDDQFVMHCSTLICSISRILDRIYPDFP